MNLPGQRSVRLVEGVRIAVGQRKSKDGPPEKLDHMRLCRWNSQLKTFTLDEEAVAALAKVLPEGQDPKKPTRIPIHVYGNLTMVEDPATGEMVPEVPDCILWARMAYYWGKRCLCASDKFTLKTEKRAKADGLDWPLDPDALSSYIGRARRRKYEDRRLVGETIGGCNPMTCPFATGEANQKHPGTPLCKPQVKFNCALPWMPALGTFAKVVTTSWQTYASLRGTLLQIGMQNRGWLLQLPLVLVSQVRTVNADGFTGTILHVEFPGSPQELRETTLEVQGALVGLDQQLLALNPADLKALDDGEDAAAFSAEFAPDTDREDLDAAPAFELENYAEAMGEELGWSEAEFAAQQAGFAGDEGAFLAHLEGLTGRAAPAMPEEAEASGEPSDVEDADFEEEPEDAGAVVVEDLPDPEEDPFGREPDPNAPRRLEV